MDDWKKMKGTAREFTAKEWAALEEIELAADGDSLEECAKVAFSALSRVMPCDRFDIGLAEERGRRVTLRHVIAGYEPLSGSAGLTADVAGGPFEHALTKGEVTIAAIVPQQDDEEYNEIISRLSNEGLRSIIVAPIVSGEPIGFISCASKRERAYEERNALILAAAIRLMRHAIERAYHVEQNQRNYRAYMEMLSFVAHELKSPLASIITQIQTMAEGYYGKLETQQREVLDRVIKKAEYLHTMSSQYLTLAHFESSEMALKHQLVDFTEDVIEPVLEILAPQIEERKIALERGYDESVYPVRCNPDLMKIVMMNLIGNGIKYGNRGSTLRVSLSKSYKKYEVSVWNEGPGFSEEERHRLFKKFSRLQATELAERKGSGIGLYVSWRIVRLHGGRIYAESEQGSWARFTVELPQYPEMH